jgi:hypothetical protein
MEDHMFNSHNRFAHFVPFIVTSENTPLAPQGAQIVGTQDLYASAWTKAQRDYEIDRLFNASFYYEI